jgi:hypothetical protein
MTRQRLERTVHDSPPAARPGSLSVSADYARTLLLELTRLGGEPERLWRDAS